MELWVLKVEGALVGEMVRVGQTFGKKMRDGAQKRPVHV